MSLQFKNRVLISPSPIERLNDDVLLNIMSRTVDPLDRTHILSLHREATSLLSLSHTSRWFRAVALSSAQLWGQALQPDRNQLRWLKLLLERSADSDIYIVADTLTCMVDPEGRKVWELVEQHFHRCVSLSVAFGMPPSLVYSPCTLLYRPAPRLQHCFVHAATSARAPFYISKHLQFRVPSLFQNAAPNLRSVQFTYMCSTGAFHYPPLHRMAFLATTPIICQPILLPDPAILRILTITNLGPINRCPALSTPFSSYSRSPTSLPSLKSLHLTGQISWIHAVLNNFSLSNGKCNITLDMCFSAEGRAFNTQTAVLWKSVFKHFPHLPNPSWSIRVGLSYTELSISRKDGFTFSICIYKNTVPLLSTRGVPGNTDILLGLTAHPGADQIFLEHSWSIIATQYTSISQAAQKLALEFDEDTPFPYHLEALLPSLGSVYRIRLSHYAAQDLRCYTLLGLSTEPSVLRVRTSLPSLRLLSIPHSAGDRYVLHAQSSSRKHGKVTVIVTRDPEGSEEIVD
ncbi:hypothetical protein DFP72DRAFT_851809 [Ephemerocybe angulata]|uniref:F-box domain-containing protein n=1 Tax=Ephemerocybe angulata TaxID=980116 RepID=A0A8H6HP74_9AGAR|nr:hypothetical protein DFP72DRAFT_851809 [Tulosesus angulatus]